MDSCLIKSEKINLNINVAEKMFVYNFNNYIILEGNDSANLIIIDKH
jgi:hypothetical protein